MKSVLFAALVFAFITVVPPLAHGQGAVPKLINYQGKLTDSAGIALADGEYSVKFELFDAASAGTLVWGETRPVTLVGGIFNVALGGAGSVVVPGVAVNDIGFAFASSERYLQTTIESGPGVTVEQTLLPRQQMTSVPFAVGADQLGGHRPSWWVPTGTVVAFAGPVGVPAGWLRCDGTAISRTEYADLFDVIGTAHGQGNGSTTFHLPDYRARFLRMGNYGSGRDEDRGSRQAMNVGGSAGDAIGSVQNMATARPSNPFITNTSGEHTHNIPRSYSGPNIYETKALPGGGNDGTLPTQSAGSHTHTVTGGGDAETRPENAYVQYIIKY